MRAPTPRGGRQTLLVNAALLLALSLGLGLGLPRANAAQRSRPRATTYSTPLERALTGGVVTLRAPRSIAVRIPGTSFAMGSTAIEIIDAVLNCSRGPAAPMCKQELFADETPAHAVSLSSYWIDRTEVTVAAYARCVKLRRCAPLRAVAGARRFMKPTFPVSMVTQAEAMRYCRFRGARLPTEAEWERAARGAGSRTYPWGNIYNSHAANHGRLGIVRTDATDGYAELAPVGSFPDGRTPEGALDLAGNVAEWVSDRMGLYPGKPQHNPRGAKAAGPSIVRGGHYLASGVFLRSADRVAADPDVRRPFIGFRCARSARRRARAPRR